MKKAERFRKEIVLLFPVFLVFPDKAQGKSGNFLFPIFAYYTTTREKGELRRHRQSEVGCGHYTTTREKGELRQAKAAGDNNALARYIKQFTQATVDVTVLDITNEVASMVLGATIESGSTQKGLSFSGNDVAPYVGLGFYTTNLLAENVVRYKAIFYPRCKASMQGKTYDTKGDSITLSNSKLQLTASVCNKGARWKM